MASLHAPQSFYPGMRLNGKSNFTSTLQDPLQWPSLGQPSDSKQCKKVFSGQSVLSGLDYSVRPKTNSIGESSVSSSKCSSSDTSAYKSESDAEGISDTQPQSFPALSRQTSTSKSCPNDASDDSSLQNPPLDLQSSDDNPNHVRRNSSGEANVSAAKKKGVKTKWIPLELPGPNTGLSIRDKLRLRRQLAGFEPHSSHPQSDFHNDSPSRPVFDKSGKLPPRTYGYSGSYYRYQYHNGPARMSFGYAGNGGCHRPATEEQSQPWQRPMMKYRNGKNRKFQGFRNREIMFDSEYAGRDVDQFSEGPDDGSFYEPQDHSYYDDGSRPSSVGYWYDGSCEGSMMDSSYASGMASDGYATDDYDHFGYFYMDPSMEGTGYYSMEEECENYGMVSDADLKQLIKTQIEYYFSPENLEKDFFLRRNMAEDGSVHLNLVATFQRVRSLCQDFYTILESVGDSTEVELLDGYRVRPRANPDQWPLKDEDNGGATYYLLDGDIPAEDANWTYYDERLCFPPVKDEENESGHCDDGYQEDNEEEAEESVSVGGSETAEVTDVSKDYQLDSIREQLEPLAV